MDEARAAGGDQLDTLAFLDEDRERWSTNPVGAFSAWKASERVRAKQYAGHSVDQYTSMFSHYVNWLNEKGLRLADARGEHLDLFLSTKQGRVADPHGNPKPAAASTRRRYLQLLNKVYTHLRLIELTKTNPAAPLLDLTKHQAVIKPAPRVLSIIQQDAYIKGCLDLHRQQVQQLEAIRVRAANAELETTRDSLAEIAPPWVAQRDLALRLLFLASGITVQEMQRLKPEDLIAQPATAGADGSAGEPVLLLNVAAHHFVAARVAPVAAFANEALLGWQAHLRRMCLEPRVLFPGRKVANNFDNMLDDKAISSSEAYLCVQPVLDQIAPGPRQGPQTLRNSFMLRQIYEGAPFDRIMAWTGLESPESLHRIKKMVPLRMDGVRPT